MKNKYILLSLLLISFTKASIGQIVSGNAFLKGDYIEVGMRGSGSFGTSVVAPTGYHPRTSTTTGLANSLGFVADPAKDGWTVGTPNYFGDFFVPGNPEEGWAIKMNNVSYNNNTSSGLTQIAGNPLTYLNTGANLSATWSGTKNGLEISSTTSFPKGALYFVTTIKVKNTTASTINNVYYMRTVDADQERPLAGGSNSTINTIVQQNPNISNTALVTSVGQLYSAYLGLGSRDCRARVTRGGTVNPLTNRDPQMVWSGTNGLFTSGVATSDAAISISFYLGNLAPGDSTTFAFAYILGLSELNLALAATEISFLGNGATIASNSSVNTCSGSAFPLSIQNGFGYSSWVWAPTTGLSPTTGSSVTATLTSPQTYTVTGTGLCGSLSLNVSLNPITLPIPGAAGSIDGTNCLTSLPLNNVTYSVTPIPDATTYVWSVPAGSGIISGSGTNIIQVNFTNTFTSGNISVYGQNVCYNGAVTNLLVGPCGITTGAVAVDICKDTLFQVPYTVVGSYNATNLFIAQLSDSTGNFSAATDIGSISSITNGIISATISGSIIGTTGYRIRVISTDPVSVGGDNSADITVQTPPSISCPANQSGFVLPGLCNANISYSSSPIISGVPLPDIMYSFSGATNNSGNGDGDGSSFNVGITSVKLYAANSCGIDSCAFTVTVVDNEPPTITCNNNITVGNDNNVCGAAVTYTVTSTDNCAGETVVQTAGLASGATFPVGTTTNKFLVTDASGNKDSCTFTITINDTTKPSIICSGPVTINNSTGLCTGSTTLVKPIVSDNCNLSSLGNALHFDGVNDVVATDSFIATNLIGDLTVETWFKATSLHGKTLVTRDYTTDFDITLWSNQLNFYHGNGTSYINLTFNYFFNPNTWYHIAVVRNISTKLVSLYVNGVFQQTLGWTSPDPSTSNAPLYIGKRACCPSFEGSIDEVRIWNTQRTASEIANNMNNELVGTETGLQHYFKLNDGLPNGNNTNDTITNATAGLSGTLQNFSLNCTTTSNYVAGNVNTNSASITNNAPCIFPVGNTTVIWTATDASGNTNTCTQIVTVVDTTKPTITCPGNISQHNDANLCSAIVTFTAPVGTDNCPLSTTAQTQGLASGSVFPIGTTTNSFMVTDASGNKDSCSFTVTINDTTKPILICSNMYLNTITGSCNAVPSAFPIAIDNCPGSINVYQTAGAQFGQYLPIGSYPVEFQAIDSSGNIASCAFTVTISDTTKPTISCPGNITQNNDANLCSAVVTFSVTSSDNCSGQTVALASGLASGSVFPLGTTTNKFIVTDASGNKDSCSFTVTITDTTKPIISCVSNITQGNDVGSCSAVVNYTAPTATDNCAAVVAGNQTFNYTGTIETFTVPAGVTNLSIIAKGAQGGNALTLVGGLGASMSGDFSVTPGQVFSILVGQWPGLNDNGGGGGSFVVLNGSNTPYLIAGGGGGAAGDCCGGQQNGMPGVLTTSGTVGANVGCSAGIPGNNGNGGSGGFSSNYDSGGGGGFLTDGGNGSPANGGLSFLNGGSGGSGIKGTSSTISVGGFGGGGGPNNNGGWNFGSGGGGGGYSGGAGNCGASEWGNGGGGGSYNIGVNPNNTSGANSGHGQVTIAWNQNTNPIPVQTSGLPSGSTFPIGTTTNVFVVTDASGNKDSCTFTITISDTTKPSITCPGNITQANDAGLCSAVITYTAPVGMDNCPLPTTAQTQGLASGQVFPVGTTINKFVVTDASGNKDSCSFMVTIVDTTKPSITCAADVTISNATGLCSGTTVLIPPTVTDNCSSVLGNALDFDGTPNYATLPPGVYFNGDFTIECWVYPKAFSNWSRIIDFGNGAGSNNVLLGYTYGTSGNPGLYIEGTQIQSSALLTLNQWSHIAATFTGGIGTIYVNGVAAGSGSFPTPANITRNLNYVGRSNWGLGDPDANAIYDELRIWNVARTPAQIQSTMSTELTGSETGLQVYFPFNQGVACGNNTSITQILDMAPSGGTTNGTLFNFTLNGSCTKNFTNGFGVPTLVTNNAPSTYPLGNTTVTWTATDAAGNTSTCAQIVTINDTTKPTITCPSNISQNNDVGVCDAVVTFAPPTATDNCLIGGAGIDSFLYNNSVQTWTVPAGVTSLKIKTWGAQGGTNLPSSTNYGGYAEGDLIVTPGETLSIYVGGQASGVIGGFNGGGNGDTGGQGGGGASDVRQGGTGLNDRRIVAAGAGGGGLWISANLEVVGGIGGGLTGGDGYRVPSFTISPGGLGATQTAGGANGTCASFNVIAMAGGLGYGGTPLGSNCGCNGYGGGGGWYGGAGSGNCRGGGGGSSYIGSVSSGITNSGVRAGHGKVEITYNVPSISINQTSGLPSGSTFPIGTTTNVFVATDASGNTDTCYQTVTITSPDIDVKGNTLSIIVGDITPDLTDHSDFGQTTIAPITRTFTIQNIGTANLALTSGAITITGANASLFTLSNISLPATLSSPSGSITFDITYTPLAIGVHNATVNIASNDCDEAAYDFDIKGERTCTIPVFTSCPSDTLDVIALAATCTAPALYNPVANGIPSPTYSYIFTGQTNGAGSGKGSGLIFNLGITLVQVIATNACGSDTCSFVVNIVTPEMTVFGNGNIIADGDMMPTMFDNTDFGNTNIVGGQTQTFYIYNSGTGNLFIPGFTINGLDSASFIVSNITLPATVALSSFVAFDVTFAPTSIGSKSAVLHILNNDCDENTYDFALQGNGTCTAQSGATFEIACNEFVWNGITYTTTGVYSANFITAAGCDSLHTLNLTINHPSMNAPTQVTIANSYVWAANNTSYTMSGTYTISFTNVSGCDSSVTLQLHILNIAMSLNQNVTCFGSQNGSISATASGGSGNFTYDINGANVFTNTSGLFNGLAPGVYTICAKEMLSNALVCDTISVSEPSLIIISMVVDSLVSCHGNDGAISASVSGGIAISQPYLTTWSGGNAIGLHDLDITGLTPGVYTLTVEDDMHCFQSASITLLSAPPITVSATHTSITCFGGTSIITANSSGGIGMLTNTISGGSFTVTAGTYTVTSTDTKGCSAATVIIVSEPSLISSSETVDVCDDYHWLISNLTYTTTGVYTQSFIAANGCDSIAILNLTIRYSSSSTTTVSMMGCYTWLVNNTTYTVSGNYSETFMNSSGCDSVSTLALTITPGVFLNSKVLLAGPYDASLGLMTDSLRQYGLIPTLEPYSSSPYNKTPIGEPGGETVSSSLTTLTGPDAIVDWVFLELRDASNPATIIANKRALVQRDGDIVSHLDGVSAVKFATIYNGNYYVSVKHRNHLGVMSANQILLNGCSVSTIDFTSSSSVYSNVLILNTPRKLVGSVSLLWSADANNNKNVKYNGLGNDKDKILDAVGPGTPNATLSPIYRVEDLNMDGKLRYNNTDNDRALIINNLGVSTPNKILYQHTPN